MSFIKILNFDTNAIDKFSRNDFANDLSREIEEKLAGLDDVEGWPYAKSDMVQLIGAIETCKMKCLMGEINAKRLYCDVDYALSLFKLKHPGFDYLTDPALNVYYYS
jgi:hypothetical protein